MKWTAIVNSRSAAKSAAGRARLFEVLRPLTEDVCFTRYPGHALELSQQAATRGHDGIIAVGGDGTVHEILRHLHLPTQRLIILPAGTGNSLAKDVGMPPGLWLPPHPENGPFVAVDLNRVRGTLADGSLFTCFSSSTVAVGYPARATDLANRHLKRLKGHCYSAASLLSLLSRRRVSFLVQYDGQAPEEKAIFGLMISNTRHMGNFVCFPAALPDDGLANVMELTASALPQLAHNLSVLTKTHFYHPYRACLVSRAHIRLPEPGLLMVDGEVYANVLSVEVEVVPRVLQVFSGHL